MALSDRSTVDAALTELFRLEHSAHKLRSELYQAPTKVMLEAIEEAIPQAEKRPEEAERILELSALAGILGHIPGPGAIDALVDILGSDEPEARHAAGSVLEEIAFERFKEVALGVERALTRLPSDDLALSELPFLLIEVPEPGVAKLLQRFLKHPGAEAVAAAIEACVELGDPQAAPAIAALENDKRTVELEEEDGEGSGEAGMVTIGELAREACHLLESDHDHDHDHHHHHHEGEDDA
jgi:HEAT repeat protein